MLLVAVSEIEAAPPTFTFTLPALPEPAEVELICPPPDSCRLPAVSVMFPASPLAPVASLWEKMPDVLLEFAPDRVTAPRYLRIDVPCFPLARRIGADRRPAQYLQGCGGKRDGSGVAGPGRLREDAGQKAR